MIFQSICNIRRSFRERERENNGDGGKMRETEMHSKREAPDMSRSSLFANFPGHWYGLVLTKSVDI